MVKNGKASQKSTPSGSAIRSSSISVEDMSAMFSRLEEKLTQKLEAITSKVDAITTRLDMIQTDQVRINLEVEKIKSIIIDQQNFIEKYEQKKRKMNLIINGIPEKDIAIHDEILKDDESKVNYICDEICENFNENHIVECVRLGKGNSNRSRPMKVEFSNKDIRYKLLSGQKKLRVSNPDIFGKVFSNPDMSYLMRKEHKRLRDELRSLKASSSSNDQIFIKKGCLYKNSNVLDNVDINNQLF